METKQTWNFPSAQYLLFFIFTNNLSGNLESVTKTCSDDHLPDIESLEKLWHWDLKWISDSSMKIIFNPGSSKEGDSLLGIPTTTILALKYKNFRSSLHVDFNNYKKSNVQIFGINWLFITMLCEPVAYNSGISLHFRLISQA